MKRVDLKKILYMDFLIRHKCTGTSKEFAAKMDMSRSTLFEYIAYMRDELEVCILFDKFLGTYFLLKILFLKLKYNYTIFSFPLFPPISPMLPLFSLSKILVSFSLIFLYLYKCLNT